MNSIILGTAVGYEITDVQPFVVSLIKSGYKGRTVLFVEDINGKTAKYLREHAVETRFFGPIILPVNIQRFLLYKMFLKEENCTGRIMLTDVRDVIFQSDPFIYCSADRLYCFEEDRSMTLAACPVNSRWILQTYGELVLREIGHNPIICAGVTVGSHENICRYLEILCKELAAIPRMWGVDQAAHNVLIRSDLISNAVICDNESGPVYTVELVKTENIKMDNNGFIVNYSGIPSVVHQYDRHPSLEIAIRKKYFTSQTTEELT